MSNQIQSMNNPPRNPTIPNVPNPQTNEGTLEYTGLPIEPMQNIMDIPPDFSWMSAYWKFHTTFPVTVNNPVGTLLYTTRVVMSDENIDYNVAQWHDIPFFCSKWWNGKITYRFTSVKPPRVSGKLLIKFRQDAFNKRGNGNTITNGNLPADSKYRSVVKEWDLAESSQFEFDITASTPIRARPTHMATVKPPNDFDNDAGDYVIADYITPWTTYEMGRITVEVAQTVMPGGIFPDTYDIIVEKALKDATFYTPTDPRTQSFVSLYNNSELIPS